jgi:hypothetical protein
MLAMLAMLRNAGHPSMWPKKPLLLGEIDGWPTLTTDTLAAIDSPQPWMIALAGACAEDASTASAE